MLRLNGLKINSRIDIITLLAGFMLTLAIGVGVGVYITVRNVARQDLFKPNKLSRPDDFPWALRLGWRLAWAQTPDHRTPEYARKLNEADSLLGFDAGVIGSLNEIKKYDWQAQKDIPRAQKAVREAFIARLGRKLDYVDSPLLKIHAVQELKGGLQRVIFSAPAEPGYRIKGCMILPPGEKKHPAVVIAYGAGGSIFNTCGWEINTYHNDMGLKLAKKGFVTVVYVLRGMNHDAWDWGKPEWEPLQYESFVGYTLLRGSTPMNIWANDGVQVVKAIERHPRVDTDKIMFAGISHGGQIAMYAGAMETKRIKGVLAMGSFLSFEDLYTAIHHWTGHIIPNIGSVGDMGDIAALIAPRPLLILWGEKEDAKYLGRIGTLRESSLAEFERVKQVYERLGAGQHIHKFITLKAGHQFDVEGAVHFLGRYYPRPTN
ncbi:MAG: alpha/beta hydrolase family protein [Candidatus Binatia bacterium]